MISSVLLHPKHYKINKGYVRTYHGRNYFKKGSENGMLIDIYTFQESFYGSPIIVFHVLQDNFEDVKDDFFYIYLKKNKANVTVNEKDTYGYNEILIEADPHISGKELLDIIKKQLNRISHIKPVNYGREITIKIKGAL